MGDSISFVDRSSSSVDLPAYGNLSFSGTDTVVTINVTLPDSNGNLKQYTAQLGSLQTLSYSIHMDRHPIRKLGNVNAVDYVMGPRTIAGTLIFTVFNRHWTKELLSIIANDAEANQNLAALADELPPFDLIVSLANEYGARARMVLYGIRLVNEGQVMSVNDIYTENTYQYYANDIEYLTDETSGRNITYQYGKKLYISSNTADSNNATSNGAVLKNAMMISKFAYGYTDHVILSASSYSPNITGGKGTAVFTLNPRKNSGIIRVTGASSIDINVSQFLRASDGLSSNIPVELAIGQYNAVYTDTSDNSSNTVSFSISDIMSAAKATSPAPIIINRTENSITVLMSNFSYSNIAYAKVLGDESSMAYTIVTPNGDKCTILNLEQNTIYRIYACSNSGEKTSSIDVSTLNSNIDPYNDLRNFVHANSDKLIAGTSLSDYDSSISSAAEIARSKNYMMSIQDAFCTLKTNLENDRKAINRSSYDSDSSYNDAVNAMDIKIVAAKHFIDLTEEQVNNEHYILNYANAAVKPVEQPAIADKVGSIVAIPGTASRLDIYNADSNRLVKTVDASSFDGKYKILTKPGSKVYVHAINYIGEKSPRLEIGTLDDSDKPSYASVKSSDNLNYKTAFSSSESEIGGTIKSLGLDDQGYADMIVMNGKNKCAEVAPSPAIVDYDERYITIDISSLDLLGNTGMYYAAISERDDAFSSKFLRKKIFSPSDSTVTFTAEEDRIRSDKTYLIWIENSDQVQISKCTIVNMSDEEDYVEKKTQYVLEDKKDEIIAYLNNLNLMSNEIASCISAAMVEEDVNVNNLYDKLVASIMSYIPRLSNESILVMAVMDAKIASKSIIRDGFFSDSIKIDEARNIVITPALDSRYTITVYKIDRDGKIVFDSIVVDAQSVQEIPIDKSYKYMTIFCISDDPAVKSDVLFIDTVADAYKSIKDKVEVIR